MSDIHHILKQYWGFETFRPQQQEIIEAVMEGKDALALMPTGGGKSLCYQVPALAQEGICIIISPLIALMKDQVENLRKKGILALAIYSGMSRRLIAQTLKNAAYGEYKFLYVSPERLETSLFLEFLPALQVNLVAVDEAHCISQWGYDFRPSYLRIATLREELSDVPFLALTASATPLVQKDICEKLLLQTPQVFQQPFTRPNLSYSVLPAEAKQAKLVHIVSKVPGTAIVYCRSRKRTQDVAALLQMHGFSADYYHAGLKSEDRSKRQQQWMDGQTKIMVCTNAFGMGIDKGDVRLVIHMEAPDSLESYYQEAGRAGRDGKKAYAVLLYHTKDGEELNELHIKRYPSLEEIKTVYSALVNYLQIPAYSGEDVAYDFHFETFVKRFNLDAQLTLSSLKALESDGWLDFNERSFTPSTIEFTVNKKGLYAFQEAQPKFENLLTTLLRTYEGIFDYPVFVSELLLAKIWRRNAEDIKKELQQLSGIRIIDYKPQSDAPQIIFRKARMPAADLLFNTVQYEKRKQTFVERVQKMMAYISTRECRSIFINDYFGDRDKKRCGICDNCLQQKKTGLPAKAFQHVLDQITEQLNRGPLKTTDLLKGLKDVSAEQAWTVINYLVAEQKLLVNVNRE
ncbi:MAG: RecQ family ATP-dependent DNA helicase, partial [Chitinophagaceae bacterium]